MDKERRRSPRIDIIGRVYGHVVALDLPVTVREISLGGMSLETPFPFQIGTLHHFTLTLGDGATVLIAGRVVHSRCIAPPDGAAAFLTGIQFEDAPADEAPGAVGDLLDRLK
jgi:hypothetical protein